MNEAVMKRRQKGAELRIDSSIVGMESARRYSSSTTKTGRYAVMDYRHAAGGTRDMFGNLLNTGAGQEETEETSGQETAKTGNKDNLQDLQVQLTSVRSNSLSLRNQWSSMENFRQMSIRMVFSLLFGYNKAQSFFGQDSISTLNNQSYEEWQQSVNSNMGSGQQFLVYSNQVSVMESESTSFQAAGTVKTADGREIQFNVDVGMSRQFAAYYEENYGIANLQTCDPLVINLDGGIAELTDQKFFFDIDGDGEKDEVSKLASGSGYLAFDKNGDGAINDGNELFGPQSGNGFQDLAQYDSDGNGWIDENDPIWSKLKIWCQNEDGTDSLYSLSDKGVGAICLQNAATDFTLNGSQGQPNGYIRNTGIFLYENGSAGTVQHVDLVQ